MDPVVEEAAMILRQLLKSDRTVQGALEELGALLGKVDSTSSKGKGSATEQQEEERDELESHDTGQDSEEDADGAEKGAATKKGKKENLEDKPKVVQSGSTE